MTTVKLYCTGAMARATVDGPLTHGMVGVPVEVEWDAAWEGLLKTMKFRCGDVSRTAIVDGDATVTVPHECLISGQWLEIGLDGWDADGNLRIPSGWASCGLVKPSVAQVDAPEGAPPTPDTLAKLQMLVIQAEEAAKNLTSALEDAERYASSADKSAGDAAGAATAAAGSASDADRSAGVASGAAAAAADLVGKIPDFQTQINALDTGKVSKEDGKGLSANDYDDASKQKVDAIPEDPRYTDTVTPVDATLSIDGEAADAKATGDALNQIKDDLSEKVDFSKSQSLTAQQQTQAQSNIGIHKVTQAEYDALTDTNGIYIIMEE